MSTCLEDQLYRYRVPFTVPIRLGEKWYTHREGLLIRRALAGICEGWGEIAPLPGFSRETLDCAIQEVHGIGDAGPSPSVTCGMEMAQLQWALAATRGQQANEKASMRLCALLIGDSQAVLKSAADVHVSGYSAVKLKVGHRPMDEDLQLVHALRKVLGAGTEMRMDANRAWRFSQAMEFAAGIRDLDVAFVEEPLIDPERLPEIAEFMPVALDETLRELSMGTLSRHRYAKAIVIKPMLMGGLGIATAWAEHATYLGIKPILSASYETGVGLLSLMHVAAQVAGDVPVGLDTYRFIHRDVLMPRIRLDRPKVEIPAFSFFQIDHSLLIRIA